MQPDTESALTMPLQGMDHTLDYTAPDMGPPPEPNRTNMTQKDKKSTPHAFCLLYPFLTLLRVTGIMYVRSDSRFSKLGHGQISKIVGILGLVYCITILIIQWLDFVRSFLAYREEQSDNVFSSKLYNKIFNSLWTLQCATYISFLFKISYKDELFKFVSELEDHYTKYTGKDKLTYSKWLKMHIYGWTLVCVLWIFMMSSTVIYLLVNGYQDTAPFPREGPWGTVARVFLGYLSVIGSCIVFLTICLFAIICGIVYKEFICTRETLECIIQSDSTCGESNLRRMRQRHQNLCSLVQDGNDMFSGILAVLYGSNIFMACLMSYNLLDAKMSTSQLVVGAIWTLAAFANFLGISVLASFLNSAAHSPVESLYDISITSSTKIFLTDLQMFTARLTGPQIGFTVYGLFVINRPTILTVAGMFLTYFFLLLQFRSPQSTSGVDMAKSCAHCLLNLTFYDNSSSVNCSFA